MSASRGGARGEQLQPGLDRHEDGRRRRRRLADGADTPVWLLTDPALDGVTGRYFWQRREEEPNPQTEDADARRRLVELARAATRR